MARVLGKDLDVLANRLELKSMLRIVLKPHMSLCMATAAMDRLLMWF